MSKLTEAARGQNCYLRLPNICTFNPEQTVLCHIRRGNIAGRGQKPSDLCAVPMCFECHQTYDQRSCRELSRDQLDSECLRALVQWLSYLDSKGLVTIT